MEDGENDPSKDSSNEDSDIEKENNLNQQQGQEFSSEKIDLFTKQAGFESFILKNYPLLVVHLI